MMTLYDLTSDMAELLELLEDDITDEALWDTLEGIDGLYEDKLDNYAAVIRTLEAEANAFKDEIDRMTVRRKTITNNIGRMKKAMYESMLQTGTKKVKGKRFTIAIQKNGGKAPYIPTFENVAELPDNLTERRPNLTALRELAESGDDTYGYIGDRGESLRIR